MIVIVMDRKSPWYPRTRTVEIADTCPACGGPRGSIYGHNFWEDDQSFFVNRWDNPCGHVDHYPTVLKEAAA